MGRPLENQKKKLVRRLRRRGLSYSEILKKVEISKDTVSRWCLGIKLTAKQKARLAEREKEGRIKGSLTAAEARKQKKTLQTRLVDAASRREVGSLSRRDRFLTGIALYAAEGDHSLYQGGFASSDPSLIRFMMGWLREFARVPPYKFRGALYLKEGRDEGKAKDYWSKLTGIPVYQFHKTIVIRSKKPAKSGKNILKNGTFSVRFSTVKVQGQILGWVFQLFDAGREK